MPPLQIHILPRKLRMLLYLEIELPIQSLAKSVPLSSYNWCRHEREDTQACTQGELQVMTKTEMGVTLLPAKACRKHEELRESMEQILPQNL